MKHYDYVEWLFYKNNLISLEKKIEMEEHLYNCDDCLEIFLSSIDEIEIEEAGRLVPDDFTGKVLKKTENIGPIKKPKKKKAKGFNELFLYYASVASVAIFLTAGGIFTSMVEVVPRIDVGTGIEESKVKAGKIYDLSESITNRISEFINNFGRKN